MWTKRTGLTLSTKLTQAVLWSSQLLSCQVLPIHSVTTKALSFYYYLLKLKIYVRGQLSNEDKQTTNKKWIQTKRNGKNTWIDNAYYVTAK